MANQIKVGLRLDSSEFQRELSNIHDRIFDNLKVPKEYFDKPIIDRSGDNQELSGQVSTADIDSLSDSIEHSTPYMIKLREAVNNAGLRFDEANKRLSDFSKATEGFDSIVVRGDDWGSTYLEPSEDVKEAESVPMQIGKKMKTAEVPVEIPGFVWVKYDHTGSFISGAGHMESGYPDPFKGDYFGDWRVESVSVSSSDRDHLRRYKIVLWLDKEKAMERAHRKIEEARRLSDLLYVRDSLDPSFRPQSIGTPRKKRSKPSKKPVNRYNKRPSSYNKPSGWKTTVGIILTLISIGTSLMTYEPTQQAIIEGYEKAKTHLMEIIQDDEPISKVEPRRPSIEPLGLLVEQGHEFDGCKDSVFIPNVHIDHFTAWVDGKRIDTNSMRFYQQLIQGQFDLAEEEE